MSGVNLQYIKGVRTRYFNVLEKEMYAGEGFVDVDIASLSLEDCSSTRKQINECKGKIDVYIEKLANQSEKLAQAVGDTDEELTNKVLEEDSTLSEKALSVSFKLQCFDEQLKEGEMIQRNKVKEDKEGDHLQKFCDFQMKLQHKFFTEQQERSEKQMQLQHEYNEKLKEEKSVLTTSVKLPKLDIVSFNGNKLLWVEFWDSFKSAVHNNVKLSEIDKFNYLKGKLTGEAKSSIAGLSLSNENYSVAIAILEERFGDKQEIIDLHYKRLLNLAPARNTTESLRFFMDKAEKHLRSLEVLHENIDQHVFVSMLRSKIPSDILLQLELLKVAGKIWTVQMLRDVLRQYIVSREKAEKPKPMDITNQRLGHKQQYPLSKPMGHVNRNQEYSGALMSTERNTPPKLPSKKCRFCDKGHWSDECNKFKTVEERKKRIKGSCFRCLKDSHLANECKSSRMCVYCRAKDVHHRSLCDKKFSKSEKKEKESVHLSQEVEESESTCDESGLLSCDEIVFMQTATAEVTGKYSAKSERIRLLLDSGSHRTYISKELTDRLGLKEESEQEVNVITFGSERSKTIKTKSTTINVRLKDGRYMTMTANIVPKISGMLHRSAVNPTQLDRLSQITRNLQLADTIPTEKEVHSLDLLVGNDFYLDIVNSEKIQVCSGLYLLSSKLGWILSGRAGFVSDTVSEDMSMLILSHTDNNADVCTSEIDNVISVKTILEDFWNIESIGITDPPDSSDDEKAMINFKETLKRDNGRYQVTWPWKGDSEELPENRGLALGRLKSLVKRIQKEPDLMERYDTVIKDQVEKCVIEKVERDSFSGSKHYIPHHVVITPDKTTTKLRVVYDASAKTRKNHKSLYECLYRGPVLLRDLCGIFMRFRLPEIGIVSDIEKAFLQVELQQTERDVTRFLWFKNLNEPIVDEDHIQEYRFCRVPFGVVSSPFLLAATVETHLDSYNTELTNQMKENIYVDNIITGADTVEKAMILYNEGKAIFSDAKMNLREWITNSEIVNSLIPDIDKTKSETVKVLGHTWDTKCDTFSIQNSKVTGNELAASKRNVLKQIASVYDPLGYFAPVIIQGKTLLQRLWRKHLEWDDLLCPEDEAEWVAIKSDLARISTVKMKRCISLSADKNKVNFTLVCFSDASIKAYAASIYLLQQGDGITKSDIVFSKSRLSPIKGMTIPRLELLAVLIGVRCVTFVEKELKLPIKDVIVMTDSQCVLHWISSKKVLPVFVENRIKEIKSHDKILFCYVNTKHNPADIASRGCSLATLQESDMWWYGPDWLTLPQEQWSQCTSMQEKCSETEIDKESIEPSNESIMITQSINSEAPFGIDVNRYCSVSKLIRITAWCRRFVLRLKGEKASSKCLTNDELQEAETLWLKHVQVKHYSSVFESMNTKKRMSIAVQLDLKIDSCGLIRCGGRLEHAELSEAARFPVLLPKCERYTHLLIEKVHKRLLHCGVSQTLSEIRQEYWIPQGRATVRKVLASCKVCRRFEGGAYKLPPMASLPSARVSRATPFSKVGLDYLGPLYTKENRDSVTQKVWVCLFTCFVTRAIHLELVSDMTAQSFLLCLRRFIAAKGTPVEIISDNAQQFKLSNDVMKRIWRDIVKHEDVQNYVSGEKIKWTFIIELAPWMGGFYERLVSLVKRALRKTIGRKILTLEQITTLLKESEAVVNSRPLVYVGEDLKSSITLTPRHFICLNPHTGIPEMEDDINDPDYKPFESSADKLLKIWKKGQRMLDMFWTIWRSEYLLSLRERTQSKHKSPRVQCSENPSVNDIVLIKDDVPRGQWRMGKLIKLNVSRDGHIRSAELRTGKGKVLKRPLNLLYPVELA